jgi:hypothetical protein
LLSNYGIRPQLRPWRLAWEWANGIRLSYYDPRRPMASEVAARYTLLLLAEVNADGALKPPYRATSHAPPAIRAALELPEAVPLVAPAPRPRAALPAASPSLFDLAE